MEKLRQQLEIQNEDLCALRLQKEKSLEASRALSKETEAERETHILQVESLEKRLAQTAIDLRLAKVKTGNTSKALSQQVTLTTEAKAAVAKLKPFENRAHALEKELERAEESLEHLEKKLSLQRKQSTTETLNLQKEIQSLKEDLHASNKVAEKYDQQALQIKRLEMDNASLTRKLSEAQPAQKNLRAMTTTHNELRDAYELLKTAQMESLDKLKNTETEKGLLKEETVRLNAEVAQNMVASEAARQKQQHQICKLEKELAESQDAAKEAAQRQQHTAETEKGSLNEETVRLNAKVAQNVAASETARQEQHQRIENLAKELAESQHVAKDATERQQSTAVDLAKQAVKLREMGEAATEASSTIADLRARLDRKTTDLRETMAEQEVALRLLNTLADLDLDVQLPIA